MGSLVLEGSGSWSRELACGAGRVSAGLFAVLAREWVFLGPIGFVGAALVGGSSDEFDLPDASPVRDLFVFLGGCMDELDRPLLAARGGIVELQFDGWGVQFGVVVVELLKFQVIGGYG
jgi:hypothetical protein